MCGFGWRFSGLMLRVMLGIHSKELPTSADRKVGRRTQDSDRAVPYCIVYMFKARNVERYMAYCKMVQVYFLDRFCFESSRECTLHFRLHFTVLYFVTCYHSLTSQRTAKCHITSIELMAILFTIRRGRLGILHKSICCTDHVFQEYRKHLNILGARRVYMEHVPYRCPTNIT